MADEPKPAEDMKRNPVSPEHMEAIFSGPAPHVNRSFVTMMPGGVRIAFAEQATKDATLHLRSAVMMDYMQAIAFLNLLKRNLAEIEADFREIQAEANKASPQGSKVDNG